MLPVIRMSSSGYCGKRLAARLLSHPSSPLPSWLAGSAEEGKAHEIRLRSELRELGCDVIGDQDEVHINESSYTLVGHLDGEIKLSNALLDDSRFHTTFVDTTRSLLDLSLYYPLELKSMSRDEFQRWMSGRFDEFPQYASQFTCYMTAKAAKRGVYIVKDRNNGRRQLYILGGPPDRYEDIAAKVSNVVECVAKNELPYGEYDSSITECRRFCEFRTTICKPEAIVVNDEVLEKVLRSYVESRDAEKGAKSEKERCRDLIVAYGKDSFKIGQYVVKISPVSREDISLIDLLTRVSRETIEDLISVSSFPRVNVVDMENL